ncbi:MAG: type IV pilus assembly protein PilM [Thermoanaerobaculia bacterium]
MLFSRSKNVVGLDIGSSAVKLVELKERKGGYKLDRVGLEPLPPEAIVEGSVADATLAVEAIQRLIERTGVRNNAFATSVSGPSVIIKRIAVPRMSEAELADSIQWEAEQYIPFDIHDVRLDYAVLGGDEPGHDSLDVLLVAAKQDKIQDYVSLIHSAGRTPVAVDVDVFALQNAYELVYGADAEGVVGLLDIGASITNVHVLAAGAPVFWRDIPYGGNQVTERLQYELGLSFEDAEAVKRGQAVSGVDPAAARPLLDAMADELAAEVERAFDLALAAVGTAARSAVVGPRVERLVLSGGGALDARLHHVFARRFGVPVEPLNPFLHVDYNSGEIHDQWLASVAPMLSVAVGLAMRKVGE